MEEKKQVISEDWLSFIIGIFIFVLISGNFLYIDLLGWGFKTKVWTDINEAFVPVSSKFSSLSPILSIIFVYVFLIVVITFGAKLLGANIRKFILAFTIVYVISLVCWVLGHYANIAATPDKLEDYGITWSLNLTGEAGYILALIVGLIVGNFMPGVQKYMNEAIRPELYIKTAIVIMGAGLGVQAAESVGLASSIIFMGLCAMLVAYLIFWSVSYYIARKWFKFSKEWAAPLASGISICGVSAAIATGGAIRARPVVPIMVSSLVVIFAVVELIVLPFLAQSFLYTEPLVSGAWMGLSVKTDGAAVASGAITDGLVRAKALAVEGIKYKEGWVLMTATTVKVFIDIFIGIWAFILAIIWTTKIDKKNEADKVQLSEIWERFPKFVIGYILTFIIFLIICLGLPNLLEQAKLASAEADVFRKIFFVLTFFTIGVVSNFKKLWQEGIGRLAAVYLVALFGFIIWVGLLISWLFFAGHKPPVIP